MTEIEHPPPLAPASQSIAQDIKAGLLGLGIALGCFLVIIPVIHLIAIAAGPAVGAFFASARIRAQGWHAVVVGLTIGVGEAIAVAIIAAVLMAIGLVGTDAASILLSAGACVLALVYASSLGSLGAYFGGRAAGPAQ